MALCPDCCSPIRRCPPPLPGVCWVGATQPPLSSRLHAGGAQPLRLTFASYTSCCRWHSCLPTDLPHQRSLPQMQPNVEQATCENIIYHKEFVHKCLWCVPSTLHHKVVGAYLQITSCLQVPNAVGQPNSDHRTNDRSSESTQTLSKSAINGSCSQPERYLMYTCGRMSRNLPILCPYWCPDSTHLYICTYSRIRFLYMANVLIPVVDGRSRSP